MYLFAIEGSAPTKSNKKANVLLEYQRLVKKYGHCGKTKFQKCLDEIAQNIPLEDRCELPKSVCNHHEK